MQENKQLKEYIFQILKKVPTISTTTATRAFFAGKGIFSADTTKKYEKSNV